MLIGLLSPGLRSNGYSLARRALLERAGRGLDGPALGGRLRPDASADELLLPSVIYAPACAACSARSADVHAVAHITGGGLAGNLPRVLPDGLGAVVAPGRWSVPRIFEEMQRAGGVSDDEMGRVFNLGLGMVVAVAPEPGDDAVATLSAAGVAAVVIGEVVAGDRAVTIGLSGCWSAGAPAHRLSATGTCYSDALWHELSSHRRARHSAAADGAILRPAAIRPSSPPTPTPPSSGWPGPTVRRRCDRRHDAGPRTAGRCSRRMPRPARADPVSSCRARAGALDLARARRRGAFGSLTPPSSGDQVVQAVAPPSTPPPDRLDGAGPRWRRRVRLADGIGGVAAVGLAAAARSVARSRL